MYMVSGFSKLNGIKGLTRVIIFVVISTGCQENPNRKETGQHFQIVTVDTIKSMENGAKWSRCFLHADGAIYFKCNLVSRDGGKTLVPLMEINLEEINGAPERAVLSGENLFYSLDGPTEYVSPGIYKGKSWQARGDLKNIREQEVLFYIPDGAPPLENNSQWYGLFVYRTILRMSDNSWLMTMYGNFKADTLVPYDADAKKETLYMQRTLIVISRDEGKTWNYLSTVAAPVAGEPIAEGFVEPAITLLKDGRLLCIMRSGHHFPLYASWSSDNGKSWTHPVYTGLDRGCDPCLITLQDGRTALSWGRRFPEGWSEISPGGDKGRFVYPGEGYTNLSISSDGGITWDTRKIIRNSGSCYTTLLEIEPNILFMQSDQWYCRISVNPTVRR